MSCNEDRTCFADIVLALRSTGVTPSRLTLLKSFFLTIDLYFMGGGSEASMVIDTMVKMRYLVEQKQNLVEQQRYFLNLGI